MPLDSLNSGRETGVRIDYVAYRGYCEACQAPAIEAETLICPRCRKPAIDTIPPDRILFDQFGELPTWGRVARDVQAGKCTNLATWHDNRNLDSDYEALIRMLKRTKLYYSWSTDYEA